MTTPEAAVAEYWRLKPIIYRDPPGFGNPVTVQEWAPNTPRYSWASMKSVDHCGLSMNTLLHNIGLTMEQDFPNCAWTPTARQWADTQSPVAFADIQPGDLLLYRNAGSEYTATHIGIALSAWDGGVQSGEFNTTPDGMGREYWRVDDGYLVAAGRPLYVRPVNQPSRAEQTVHDWGAGQGMTPAGRAALLGTMLAESGIDPARTEGDMGWDALQNDGVWPGGAGYIQWTNTRDPITGVKSYRRDNLAEFAAERGKPWSDGPTQLDFMLTEIAANPADTAMWERVKAATDPVAASQDFNNSFIHPGVYGDRDEFAADFHRRILAGEFGTPAPTPEPPKFIPFTIPGTQEDTMTNPLILQIIRIPNKQPIGCMWGVPFPIEDNSIDPKGPGVVEVPMSDGVFQKLHRNWMDCNGLELVKHADGQLRYRLVPLVTE
jgi:hypothetical protein